MVTTLDLIHRIATTLQDPAVGLGLEAGLSAEATLWLEDPAACTPVIIVGPPGGAKSTVIGIIRGERSSLYYSDSLSPHAFVSHFAGKTKSQLQSEVDLLPKVRGRCLLVSDLTPLLSAPEQELRETLGILTRVFDGEGFRSDKGVHGGRGYGGQGEDWRFSMVAASTPIKQRTWSVMGNLGNRLLTANVEPPAEMTRSPESGYRERVARARNAVDGFVSALWGQFGYRGVTWDSPADQVEAELWELASVVVRWRAPIPEFGDLPVFERPFRLFQSLWDLARGHALLDDRMVLTEDDSQFVRRLALDSMPEGRRRILRVLLTAGHITVNQAAQVLRMTNQGVASYIERLERSLNLVIRIGGGVKGDPYGWELSDQPTVSPYASHWAAAIKQPQAVP